MTGCGIDIVWYNLDMNSTAMKAYCGTLRNGFVKRVKTRGNRNSHKAGKRIPETGVLMVCIQVV